MKLKKFHVLNGHLDIFFGTVPVWTLVSLPWTPWIPTIVSVHFSPSFWTQSLFIVIPETDSFQRTILGPLEFAYSVCWFRFKKKCLADFKVLGYACLVVRVMKCFCFFQFYGRVFIRLFLSYKKSYWKSAFFSPWIIVFSPISAYNRWSLFLYQGLYIPKGISRSYAKTQCEYITYFSDADPGQQDPVLWQQ